MATTIFQRILIVTLPVIIPAIAIAQEISDTIMPHELNEIVVHAPKVIHKADMDVYHPSRSAVDNSKNGMQLLQNLMIPTLNVNDALGSISAAGQAVQVRINGHKATIEQIKALLPETIKRVEWIDNPGLRYGETNYVLNFIVANPTVGGSLIAQAQPALNCAWGKYDASAKFNTGRSQWEIGGYFKLTENIKAHRDYSETFSWPDGMKLTRTETPLGGELNNSFGACWLSYNYVKPDTTVVYVQLAANRTFSDSNHYTGLLSLSNGENDIVLSDDSGSKGTTPRFFIYLEQHFAHSQMLVVDFSASLYTGHTYSTYLERGEDATGYITDVSTYIKDRNQAYGLEADYIKQWRAAKLTAGASYSANRNRSRYENLDGQIFHQRQDKVYLFAEYFQRINEFTLTAGIGAQYTDYMFKETNQGNHSWNWRPQVTISYRLNQDHQIRLSFQSWQTTPSLSQSNVTPQQIDGFQWRIGNPNLKTASSYSLALRYNFNIPRVNGSLGIRALNSPDAIAPYLYWNDNKLITSYENSRGLQTLAFSLSPQIDIIPDWLMTSGNIQYRIERMKGTGYKHYNHNWSGNVSLILRHWGFQLTGQYVRAQKELWGEKISWGENLSIIQLSYNWNKWQFGAGVIMPFGQYDQGSKMLSKWNTNEQHTRIDMKMPYISICYNLQWGHQKRGANKIINADANTDKSTAGRR